MSGAVSWSNRCLEDCSSSTCEETCNCGVYWLHLLHYVWEVREKPSHSLLAAINFSSCNIDASAFRITKSLQEYSNLCWSEGTKSLRSLISGIYPLDLPMRCILSENTETKSAIPRLGSMNTTSEPCRRGTPTIKTQSNPGNYRANP